jgi:hypothetical protein
MRKKRLRFGSNTLAVEFFLTKYPGFGRIYRRNTMTALSNKDCDSQARPNAELETMMM